MDPKSIDMVEYPLSERSFPVERRPALRFLSGCLPLVALLLSACATPEDYVARDGINDPYEQQNRGVHAFNKSLDRALLRPASRGYVRAVPPEMQDMVQNFADNLSTPGLVVNNLLQGNLKGAATNSSRFVVNTLLGFAGLVDAATIMGVEEVDTDFGETLHVWGASEGPYIELPGFGPSTRRDAVGLVVDMVINPLAYALPSPERDYRLGVNVLDRVGDRGRFGDTVDSVLYDSADSYAQSRLIYLQSRRFALGRSGAAGYDDPYDTGYDAPYDDPYDDPYEDPYAD